MTRAKFIEELQKELLEAIRQNKGKPVVLDFVDKDDDDDEYILASILVNNGCVAMSSNCRWNGCTFAMDPWDTKLCTILQGWDYILNIFLDKVLKVQKWDNLEEQLIFEKATHLVGTFYVRKDFEVDDDEDIF